MASKAKPTAGKSSRKAKSSMGRGTEGTAGGAGGLSAKSTTSPGRNAELVSSNSPGTRHTPGQRRNVTEDHSQPETAHQSPVNDHRFEPFETAANSTMPSPSSHQPHKVGSPSKPKLGVASPRTAVSSPRTAVASPRTAVASPKGGRPQLKPKRSVTSPKPDAGAARGKASGVRPKPTKAGGTDANHEQSGARTSSLSPPVAKSGKPNSMAESFGTSPGSVNVRSNAASPKSPVTSAEGHGVVSPEKGVTSPKTAGRSTAVIGVTGPRKAGSFPTSQKRGKRNVRGHVSISVAAGEDEGGRNDEVTAVSKRRHSRRKSMVAAALAKFRRSLKPETQGGDGSKSSETTLSSKDQMSLFVVLTVTGFLFAFMAILIFVFFLGGTTIPEAVACITDECVDAKEYLDNLLNRTRDPCTDFYGYVCGSWHEKGGSFFGDAKLHALFRLNATLFHMRQIKRAEETRHGMHLLRPIYSACYKFMSEPVILEDALSEALKYLDIAQLMKAARFFDVVRYLVRQSMQVGVHTLFHIRLIFEDGRAMLYITEGQTLSGKLGQPFRATRESFDRILKAWLNLTNVDDHMQLLADMDAKVGKIFSMKKSAEQQLPLRDVVADMVTGVSVEEWVTSVRDSQRDKIVFMPMDDIKTHGLNVYKPAMQVVVEHGLRNATFFLATILEADVVYVLSLHSRISTHDVSKGLYCIHFTHKCLALTWAYLASRLLAPVKSTGVIFNILKFTKEIVEETNHVFSWMNNATAVKAREAVSKTSLDVIAGEAFNISRVDYAGPKPPLDEADSFLKNLVVALKHHHTVMAANPPTRLELKLSDYEFTNSLTYVRERKAILVPTLHQNIPYVYLFRVPDFFNYGTLAALIAQILVSEVVGPLQNAWDNETRVKHAEVLSCLAERRRILGFGELKPDGDEPKRALVLSLTMSVRLAYYALMKTFRLQAGTVKVFNEYWPAAEQVFFTRFCLLWCSAGEEANPLTPREKCMLPLYNMEEFVDRYSCKDRANFTTAALCKV